MVSIAQSPPPNTAQHSYASRISESTMVLSRAQHPLLHGAMVVASGDGDGDNGGSDARRRIAEVEKCDVSNC
jgi:hypothetical protein